MLYAFFQGIMYSVKKSDIVRYMVCRCEFLYEEFRRRSAEKGHHIDQCVHIVDMEGFGARFMWKPGTEKKIKLCRQCHH